MFVRIFLPSITLILFLSSAAPAVYGQEMFLFRMEGSPRDFTYGEAAIAVANSDRVALLATPTSGMTQTLRAALDYSTLSGKQEYSFSSPATSGGVTTTETTSTTTDHRGSGVNARLMAPISAITVPAGLLLTGGSWNTEFDTRDTEGQTSVKHTGLGLHGIVKPGNTTLALSLRRITEKNDHVTDETSTATHYYYKSSSSVDLNVFELGARHEVTPTLAIAATLRPRSEKKYRENYRYTDTDLATGQVTASSGSSELQTERQEAIGAACTYSLPEQGMKAAIGIRRYFPYTSTSDDYDREITGMTGMSLATEWLRTAGGVNIAPRVGLHNHDSKDFALRSLQTGLAIIFGNMALDTALGYTSYIAKDDDDFTWNFYNGSIGFDLIM